MTAFRTTLIAGAALLASCAIGFAQSAPGQTRTIQVPPGAVVLILPAAAPMDAGLPFAGLPSPTAMIRQMDAMMADMQRSFTNPGWFDPTRPIEAPLPGLPQAGGPVSGVVVTSFSDEHGTCTQRIVYPGNGAAPVVHVSSTGDACTSAALPATAPSPKAGTPHLIQVRDRTTAPAPLTYAQAGD